MDDINSEILRQFETRGLTINEGITVDARLAKSANRPIITQKRTALKKKRNTHEGKIDKNGRPLKYMRDLDSDWVVQYDTPHYGLKEHAAVDTIHGFILSTTVTPASTMDNVYLSYCTVYSRHTKMPIKKVYADKRYTMKPNRDFLAGNLIQDGITRKNTKTAKLSKFEISRNKKISKVRYIVERYFGISHLHDKAKRARFTSIFKNRFDCWLRQAAYNIKKGIVREKINRTHLKKFNRPWRRCEPSQNAHILRVCSALEPPRPLPRTLSYILR